MPRFFVGNGAIRDGIVTLAGDDAHHIGFALRMAVGEEISVCDPSGTVYRCRLSSLDGTTVTAEILDAEDGHAESPSRIRLYMAFPKGDKLETVVQKAVELGAAVITPFESERCVRRPHADKTEKQTERLRRIALEAAKQCGRTRLPEVTLPTDFAGVLADPSSLRIFCYEGGGTESLRGILENLPDIPGTIAVVVGSEGGFSPAEAAAAKDAGFRMASLGTRILRCETAPDFVLSALCYRLEL